MTALPPTALSIQQPWAWLIAIGNKQVENRSWRTRFRGEIAIHAGRKLDKEALQGMPPSLQPETFRNLPRGGIVGICEIYDCVDTSDDDWFVGPYGFLIRNARPVDFIPCRGALGFFRWEKGAAQ